VRAFFDFFEVKEFHGLHEDLKIIRKKLTPGRYSVQQHFSCNKNQTKKTASSGFSPLISASHWVAPEAGVGEISIWGGRGLTGGW